MFCCTFPSARQEKREGERGGERGEERKREKINKWEREREKELVREYKSSANVAYLLYSIKILANGPTPLQYVLWCYGR